MKHKPYDVFVQEQLAGDEIDRDNPDVLIGTAYLRNCGIYEYNQRDARAQRDLIVNELTSLTAETFRALGLGAPSVTTTSSTRFCKRITMRCKPSSHR